MTGKFALDAERSISSVIGAVISGGLVQRRADIADRDPAQVAHPAFVEMPSAVHYAAVVPDHEIALAPIVPVHELPPRRVLDQLAQQKSPIGQRPADYLRGMRGDIECLAS